MNLKPILSNAPRTLMWSAAAVAIVGLLTVLVVQTLTVVLTTRPPMVTRWFTGLFFMGQQAILASIAMGIAGYALHETRPSKQSTRLVSSQLMTRPSPIDVAEPVTVSKTENKIPSDLRAAVAEISGKRRF